MTRSMRRLTLDTVWLLASAGLVGGAAQGQTLPAQSGHAQVPVGAPAYFGPVYQAAMGISRGGPAAGAASVGGALGLAARTTPKASFDQGVFPRTINQSETDATASGTTGSYQPAGATTTRTNAFFQSLGTNGRSCATCHQPPSGMSVSLANITARMNATGGTDPIFAPVDGADCPSSVTSGQSFAQAHSLLLNKGLIRIFLPVPTRTTDATPVPVEYTITVVSDPNGCNTDPAYSTVTDPVSGTVTQMVSVYRRPTISGNLGFKTTVVSGINGPPRLDRVYRTKLPIDPATGLPVSGNLLWDGREPTLTSQASDATLSHAQAIVPPTADQLAQMVAFETGMFNAQASLTSPAKVGLTSDVPGGPVALSATQAGHPGTTAFTLFDNWSSNTGTSVADQLRQSISRGQVIFNTRRFAVTGVAGFNAAGSTTPAVADCGSCHGQLNAGSNQLSDSQMDEGIGGDQPGLGGPSPSSDLPVFKVTCKPGFSTFFNGSSVLTNDPGLALITGRCSDAGRLTTPSLRGLASRPPYFSDGSAADLAAVVSFYNARFNIGLSATDQQDLANFLGAL